MKSNRQINSATKQKRNKIKSKQTRMLKVLKEKKASLLKLPGVHYVDIGHKYVGNQKTSTWAIRIHVETKLKISANRSGVPKRINGYKTDVIVSKPKKHNTRRNKSYSTLTGGICVQNRYEAEWGTLGAIFYGGGQPVGLSNYHVLFGSSNNRKKGDEIVQPFNNRFNPNNVVGKLENGDKDLDCAIFKINDLRDLNHGVLGVCDFIDVVDIPCIDDRVIKSGVGTCVTYGLIDGVSNDKSFVIVPLDDAADRICGPGDSGAIWLLDGGDTHIALGLHHSGNTDGTKAYAYSLSKVMKQLKINLP
jgi:hypothetical protein